MEKRGDFEAARWSLMTYFINRLSFITTIIIKVIFKDYLNLNYYYLTHNHTNNHSITKHTSLISSIITISIKVQISCSAYLE